MRTQALLCWLSFACLSALTACVCGGGAGGTAGAGGGNGGGAIVCPVPAGGAGGGAAAFTPADLPGLAFWLDADRGYSASPFNPYDGGAAGDGTPNSSLCTWLDQSGAGNHATCDIHYHVGNPHVYDGHHYCVPPSISCSTNGHQLLKFDMNLPIFKPGNCLGITDSATLHWGGGWTIAAVVAYTNTPVQPTGSTTGIIYAKVNNYTFSGPLLMGNAPLKPSIFGQYSYLADGGNLVYSGTANDGVLRVVVLSYVPPYLELRLNGTQAMRTTVTPDPYGYAYTVQSGEIGGEGEISGRLHGTIGELIGVDGNLAPGDITSLETYLMTKFGLP